jgi:IPT/TIG domain-containing protein
VRKSRVFKCRFSLPAVMACTLLTPVPGLAGGPKYVAGVSYFNQNVIGQPVIWAGGQALYFVDQGALGPLSNVQAVVMVDAAAAVWNTVPTAAVNLSHGGSLAEDVSGANTGAANGLFASPSDVAPSATGVPVGVVFDSDGAVIEALEGTGTSTPGNCSRNGVLMWLDNMNPDATLAHGVIVLNGRCATSANLLAMMSYQLERAFGRILGLDFAQVNDGALTDPSANPSSALGWPVMDAAGGDCGPAGGTCIPNPAALRLDDIAALNRLYPVTAANLSSFPGKVLTAANTLSIQGTIAFPDDTGMQGVNVVARPLDNGGNPLYQQTVTFVSGTYFAGNHGNPVTGWYDAAGNRLDRFGSNDPALQGYFDLSGIPLPPGVTMANYQVSFEAVNPLYFGDTAVGPYLLGSPSPSGILATTQINGLTAGSVYSMTVSPSAASIPRPVSGPAPKPVPDPILAAPQVVSPQAVWKITANPVRMIMRTAQPGTEDQPRPLPASGTWASLLGQVGDSDWFIFPVRGNRLFTVVAQALDKTGTPTAAKAMPAVGVWDGFDPTGTTAVGVGPANNGAAIGETWLQVASAGDDVVRLGIADQRGDGRPDYLYRGWVLYADTVSPTRLPAAGGPITIRGMGFRVGDTVTVGGISAQITSLMPTEITAIMAPNTAGAVGSLDVKVSDQPQFNAIAVIPDGVSYDAASTDGLNIVTAPANQVPLSTPEPFTVRAEDATGNPAGGVTVIYAITSGTATLGCGKSMCAVTATGDGLATLPVTAINSAISVVTASLDNGASVQAHFFGGTPAALTSLTPTLYVAAGATVQWPVQALVLSGGAPIAGQTVTWQSAAGFAGPSAATTSAAGVASTTLTTGPLAEGQTATSNACLNGGSTCVAFSAFGSRPEFATLAAISGVNQGMAVGATPVQVSMRVLDINGNPMTGGTVIVSQELYAWAPPCPVHGRCAQAQLLASQTIALTSTLDGSVTFTPLTLPGVATNLVGLAATGNAGSLGFAIELHP